MHNVFGASNKKKIIIKLSQRIIVLYRDNVHMQSVREALEIKFRTKWRSLPLIVAACLPDYRPRPLQTSAALFGR